MGRAFGAFGSVVGPGEGKVTADEFGPVMLIKDESDFKWCIWCVLFESALQ